MTSAAPGRNGLGGLLNLSNRWHRPADSLFFLEHSSPSSEDWRLGKIETTNENGKILDMAAAWSMWSPRTFQWRFYAAREELQVESGGASATK
jgi:hypothetical protein